MIIYINEVVVGGGGVLLLLLLVVELLLFYSLQVFHTSIRWWFFTKVWVTESLLRSPGLFRVFKLILTILVGFNCSSDFQFLQSFFQAIGDHFKCTNYNWYLCYSYVPVFYSSAKVQLIVYLFVFFYFQSVICQNGKIHQVTCSFFFFFIN